MMAGLLQQQMDTAQPGIKEPGMEPSMEEAPMKEPGMEEEGMEEEGSVSPEEQEQYERVVLAGMKVLYDEQTHPAIMQLLQHGKDSPAEAMAQAAVTVLQAVQQQSQEELPEEIIHNAAGEILSDLATLGQEAGLFQADEPTLARAVQEFVAMALEQDMLSEEYASEFVNSVGPEEQQQIVAQQDQFAGGASMGSTPQAAEQQTVTGGV